MLRIQPALLVAVGVLTGLGPPAARAQASRLVGRMEAGQYVSPTGQFRVTLPVRPELGGSISDTPSVVTFQDPFRIHVSIGAFAQNAELQRELGARGIKEFLAWYFASKVMPAFTGARSDKTAKFLPGVMDGALLAFFELPGGSAFADRAPQFNATDQAPVAKRGNLVFVRNGCVFVISMELAERVTEGRAYRKTAAEEEDLLRSRLLEIAEKMTFPAPAAARDAGGK